MTNAKFSKQQLYYIAERSHNGIVKSVIPAHTLYDGDIVFSLSTQKVAADLGLFSEMAIEAVRNAIISAAKAANHS